VITAFSRDTSKKVYVQHKLEEHADMVWELLKTGSFYICGDAKRMATDVNQTLEKIAMNKGNMSENAAKEWIKSLRSQNRYLEDVWS
jgi:NADPH-ferrihemoprotein reductase